MPGFYRTYRILRPLLRPYMNTTVDQGPKCVCRSTLFDVDQWRVSRAYLLAT